MVVTSTDENNIKGLLSGWGISLTGRSCDSCRVAAALLFCKHDSLFLCGPCDAKVHPPTSYPRHERVWVCEVCEQAPAVVTCKADAAALCSSCDHDIHSANPLSRRHERVPVTPFLDSPTTTRTTTTTPSSAFLVPDNLDAVPTPNLINDTAEELHQDDADTWLIPNPSSTFLYNDSDILNFSYGCTDLETPPQFQQQESKPAIVVDERRTTYAFTDSVVPSQSHGNNSSNFTINGAATDTSSLFENCFNIDFTQPNKHHKKNHHHNTTSPLFSSTSSFNYSVSSSDIGVVPDGNATSMSSEVSYTFAKSTAGDGGAPVMDREARVLRYREKRKNRKFEKTIRYASRKAYAETRPRVKGRFAKRTDKIETSENDFAVDIGYGVVPAF